MSLPPELSETQAQVRREGVLASVRLMLEQQRVAANAERRRFFQPDCASPQAYAESLGEYRTRLREMLGWPLWPPASYESPASSSDPTLPDAEYSLLQEDEGGRIYLLEVSVLGDAKGFGLLFLPPNATNASGAVPQRLPLVIAQHGGLGTPEVAAGLTGNGSTANYNDLIRGLRCNSHYRGKAAVFAPQLLVWDKGQEPQFNQNLLDREFRHLGGSRAAYDLLQLQRFLDVLVLHPEIDPESIGMAGLSYGGFYTLYFAALEPRIRVAVSSCFVNDRYRYNWEDWVWKGSATRFLDSEVARMICPRPLFLEAGAADTLFAEEGFMLVAEEVAETYARLGIPDHFAARVHPGGHEYDTDSAATAFLMKWLLRQSESEAAP
jgi:dienelactone hydrolase